MRVHYAWFVGLCLLAGCGKDAPPPPLAYVPADTPYVFANRVPTPKAVIEAWMKISMSGNVERDIERMRQLIEAESADETDADTAALRAAFLRWMPALGPELSRLYTMAGIEELGFDLEGDYAFYGHGLLPVMRIQLGQPERFAEAVARVEQRAGEKLATRTLGDATFWQLVAGKVELLFGTSDGQLVATLGPSGQSEAAWQQQLGLSLPAKSLQDSGALAELDLQQGYTGHGSGWIDLRELVRRLTGRDAGDAAVMTALGLPVPAPTASCLAEYDAIAARAPRMHTGISQLSVRELTMTGLWEMDPAFRAAVATLPAPIPGPGAKGEGMLRFGLSVDGSALLRQLGLIARAIKAAPFACEDLEPINQMATELDEGLKNPALGMAGAVNAVQIAVDAVRLDADGKPEQLEGVMAVGGAMPPMLWSLLQSSVPPLAGVTLSADGKPVALPEGLWPLPIQLQALMTSGSLALAAGDVAEPRFLAEATKPAAADGTLLYYQLTGAAFTQIGSLMRTMGAELETPDPSVAETAELLEKMGTEISDIRVQLRVDSSGLRMEQAMRRN